ncbi:MAG: hypothetical protein ISS74_04715 [Planctomycetes bacterium]|nr:hypothetical protein [Planctomycetota bacterium]
MRQITWTLAALVLLAGCAPEAEEPMPDQKAGETKPAVTFGSDVAFLKKHVETIVLSDADGNACVAVVPAYQGRVMTSTDGGTDGASYGWINRSLIESGETLEHINPFGGEDRFWLGPEGGQYAIFFEKDEPFDLEHWQTPAPIDTDAWKAAETTGTSAAFQHAFTVTNFSGFEFQVTADRTIRLLAPDAAWKHLGVAPADGVSLVAYETVNRITNAGEKPWTKETGLLSIWILGMYNPSAATTVACPIKPGPEADLGPKVIDDYFGKVPAERLVVEDDVAYFSGDGKCRSKIGIQPERCTGVIGSYDAAAGVLTIVQFTFDPAVTDYVNSLWKLQDEPYNGDAANSYNDGPAEPGAKPMGPFYELESSSPAAALGPGASLEHVHRTIHLRGPAAQLDPIAKAMLGVGIDEIAGALK